SSFNVTAPSDSRLDNGGNYVISGLYDANKVVATDNYFTFASNYGEQLQHWNGFDFTLNARLRQNVLIQGGVSTGKAISDVCDIVGKIPELAVPIVNVGGTLTSGLGAPYCHQETPFLTQVKLLGSYTVPKIDVSISGSFQSLPGPQLSANQVVPNATVRPSL